MGREIRGSNAGRAAPATENRRYGALTSAAPLDRDISFDHVTAPEQGYCSLASKIEAPLSRGGGGEGGLAQILRRVVGGAVFITLFAAAVSTLYGGMASSESGVRGAGAGYSEMKAEKPHSGVPSGTGTSLLKIRASNEYGELDKSALTLYSLEMVMEPFRETTLEVERAGDESLGLSSKFVWRLQHADDSGITYRGEDDVWSFSGGPEAVVTVDRPGTLYVLTVQNVADDGVILAEGRVKVSCKYVRREIRSLTDEDREAFFDTMEIWYTIPTSEGKVKYGSKFENYERVTAYHDAKITEYCYHDGIQFLTSHATFNLITERYLQMISPKVTLPMWDFMIESATMGDEWYNSIIFDKDWFGSALGSPENDFMVSEGRFANISTIYDPEKNIVKRGMKSNHNAYGYVTSICNYQDLPRLTRTSSYCGLTSHSTFGTAEIFISCFDDNDSLNTWEDCLETKVHGDLHGLLGGAFNCNTDMKQFADDHPEYSVRLLSFVLEYITFNYWPMNAFIPSANTCDTECTKGQTEPCGCTCNIDAFAISDQEAYDYCEVFMTAAIGKFTGDEFITYDADATYPYGFLRDEVRMSDEETLLLMRYMVKIGCEPGSVGAMSTGSSPLDPLFWTLHGLFEKALHILTLTPQYRERYDMEWVDRECNGSGFTDKLPFTESILGLGTGNILITNERILELMHPSNVKMPYIYEDLNNWGGLEASLVRSDG